jgi:hypothetical protein
MVTAAACRPRCWVRSSSVACGRRRLPSRRGVSARPRPRSSDCAQYSLRPSVHGGVTMLRSRWPMSKWLLADGIAGWGSSQAYPLLAGPSVGSDGLGGLKAAQSLISGPMPRAAPGRRQHRSFGGVERARTRRVGADAAGVPLGDGGRCRERRRGRGRGSRLGPLTPRLDLRARLRAIHEHGEDHCARVPTSGSSPRPSTGCRCRWSPARCSPSCAPSSSRRAWSTSSARHRACPAW